MQDTNIRQWSAKFTCTGSSRALGSVSTAPDYVTNQEGQRRGSPSLKTDVIICWWSELLHSQQKRVMLMATSEMKVGLEPTSCTLSMILWHICSRQEL
jgi:hypothetical protein